MSKDYFICKTYTIHVGNLGLDSRCAHVIRKKKLEIITILKERDIQLGQIKNDHTLCVKKTFDV